MTDQYAWWREALNGVRGDITPNDPMSGFYRNRRPGKQATAVAFWRDKNLSLRCRVNGADIELAVALELWPFASKEPVSHEAYKAKVETGNWPDMDPKAAETLPENNQVIGHNRPPADATLADQIEAALVGVAEYTTIKDDTTSARAQSLRSRLLELRGEADDARKAEKEPHWLAAKAADAKWMPIIDKADAAAKAIKRLMDEWETEKLNARKAAAAEAAKAAATPEQKAAASAPLPRAEKIKGGYGRAASVSTVEVARIIDQAKVYEAFKDHPEVKGLLQKLAQNAVNKGIRVEGIETVEEARVK